MIDKIFNTYNNDIKDFEFNTQVAEVFDNMVERSVPNYQEIHKIIQDIARRFFKSGRIYDLGCSTGSTIELLLKTFAIKEQDNFEIIGIDNSKPMLKKAQEKLSSYDQSKFKLECSDLENIELKETNLVIMNYTLQFLPIKKRSELIKKIVDALEPGGLFILAEKIDGTSPRVHNMLTDLYYDFKRKNGYSELEIAQKRQALEDVMIPLTPNEQLDMIKACGLNDCELVFRWFNFCCYLGVK